MKQYIAIIKTVADLDDKTDWVGIPDNYPQECVEFETKEAALAAYPNAVVMTIPEYQEYMIPLLAIYQQVKGSQ